MVAHYPCIPPGRNHPLPAGARPHHAGGARGDQHTLREPRVAATSRRIRGPDDRRHAQKHATLLLESLHRTLAEARSGHTPTPVGTASPLPTGE